MKKIVLLGDSVRQLYEPVVRKKTAGEWEVWGPEQNCAFAKWTLYALRFWREKLDSADVIHWNNGLHDVVVFFKEDGTFVSLEEYKDSLRKVARELKKTGAKVIFATTTPIGPKNEAQRSNADIDAFNRAALEVLPPMGIEIDDLHAAINENPQEYLSEDDIHPGEKGIEKCAQSVIDSIRRVL